MTGLVLNVHGSDHLRCGYHNAIIYTATNATATSSLFEGYPKKLSTKKVLTGISVVRDRSIRGRPAATIGLASFRIGPKDHFFDI